MTLKGNCKENVFQYLSSQNRPYSANDVMQNLHKEFGKTAIQKALDDLTSECKIREKTYGKQKVYSVIQESEKGEEIALELVTLDSKIEETTEKLKLAESELKKAEEALQELENEPSTEKALNEKKELEVCIERLEEKIEALSKTSFKISDTEKKEISEVYENTKREQLKRKRVCMDIINSIMENYPKKLKNLFEEIGIEPDDVAS